MWYLLRMKKIFFEDNYYQIPVVAYKAEIGRAEYQRVHVLAKSHAEAVRRARTVNEFDYESFNLFLLQYRFLKDVLAKEYYQLKTVEILRFYFEACLRTWSTDCRSVNTEVLLRRTANRVISQYVRNRNKK